MPSLRHVVRNARFAAFAALAFTLVACAGDGGPSAPGARVSLHLLDAGAITEATTFGVRLRGMRPDSVTGVRIGGADAIAGVEDSTLYAVMPLGAAGSVTLDATVYIGTRSVNATLPLTRAAGPTIGDPVAATAALLSDVDTDIMDGIFLPPGDGVDPDLLAAERDDIAALRDSLQAQLERLDPTSRGIALSIIRQMRDEATASLLANAEVACNRGGSDDQRRACITQAKRELRRKLIRAAKWGVVVGASAWLVLPAGATAAGTIGVVAAAGIAAAVLSYGAVEAKTAISEWVNSSYTNAVESVVLFQARVEDAMDEQFDQRAPMDAFSASVVAPITMRPGIPRRLPIVRDTRSTILGDTFPVVRGLADSVNMLAQHWNEFSAKLPRPLRLSAPTIGVTPVRTMSEPATFGEVSVVGVREGAATSVVTATLSDAQPGIDLTLSGTAGTGRDLTVRLAVDGNGAGRVEFDVPIRYEAAPDTLDAIRAIFEGQRWGHEGAEFIQPWTVTSHWPGHSVAFTYCYGDPMVRVRCNNYRFQLNADGTVTIVVTSGFNGYTTYWAITAFTSNSVTFVTGEVSQTFTRQ